MAEHPEPPPENGLPAAKSQFTFRHLNQLSKHAVDCPLRVIAHIDLDAFYAQCEMKRLGVPEDVPLAVQQWQNLIAVNYPAREHGITRHIAGEEARKLCPEIRLVHVATWTAGESHWSYRESPSIANSKASLDPYRAECKRIVSLFRSYCPLVEKASIDESFLDLSSMVHERLLQRYPALTGPPPYNDPTECLPLPEMTTAEVDWHGSHLVEVDGGEVDGQAADWDDVAMAIGAEMVGEVRALVRKDIGYTCSAGISGNKMLAKLGSGYKKPNQQSVVRTAAIQPFLNTFKFTKIRNLGGKLGAQIEEHFSTTSVPELLKFPLNAFMSLLSDDTATWVYNILRGVDRSPVTSNTALGNKSMLSAKSFRAPALPASLAAARSWLEVLVSDLASRCEEEGVMEGRRRPKTMNISFVPKDGTQRVKQIAIPPAGKITKELLLEMADGLLKLVVEAKGAWPCIRMTVGVGGFKDEEKGNQGIGAFLVRGEQAREANSRTAEAAEESAAKRRKIEPALDRGIGRFFTTQPEQPPSRQHSEQPFEQLPAGRSPTLPEQADKRRRFFEHRSPPVPSQTMTPQTSSSTAATPTPLDGPTLTCPECSAAIPVAEEDEHRDWHFAKQLADEERAAQRAAPATAVPPNRPPSRGGAAGSRSRGGGRGRKAASGLEKGQRKLQF